MSSIMGVQRAATARNQRAEKVTLYLFSKLADFLEATPPSPQAKFTSSIAHDIWDTKLLFNLNDDQKEIWSQTTCYKGHGNPSQREPNKGYEFRETITELLSLLATHDQPTSVRTLHVTYGNYRYAYPWMHYLKGHLFDRSIVLNLANADIHEVIDGAIGALVIESEVFKKLDDERKEQTELGLALDEAFKALSEWASNGFVESRLGRALALVVRNNLENLGSSSSVTLRPISIKSRIVSILLGKTSGEDSVLVRAAEEFLTHKPFLLAARSYLDDWNGFKDLLLSLPDDSVKGFVHDGWQSAAKIQSRTKSLGRRVTPA